MQNAILLYQWARENFWQIYVNEKYNNFFRKDNSNDHGSKLEKHTLYLGRVINVFWQIK